MENFVTHIAENKRKTFFLVATFVVLTTVVIGTIALAASNGDPNAAFAIGAFGAIASLVTALISYFRGASILMSISGAKEITHPDDPELFNVVSEMAIAAGIPCPRIFVIEDTALNAFATGRDPAHACVAITSGLRQKLTRDELQGVMAHEVSHIVNYDIRLTMLIAVMAGVIVLLCDNSWRILRTGGRRSSKEGGVQIVFVILAIILAILAPIIAKLLQLAVSRSREYLADATAVKLTRNPVGLASALEKLTQDTEVLEAANRATEHLYIVSPTKKLSAADVNSIWSTHPPVHERIKRLMSLAS